MLGGHHWPEQGIPLIIFRMKDEKYVKSQGVGAIIGGISKL